MHVELRPPPVGNTQIPIPITGPGTLELREDGLHVTGAKVVSHRQGLLLLIGMVAIGIPIGLLQAFTELGEPIIIGLSAAIGGPFLIKQMRKPPKAGEPVSHIFPWEHVKKVHWEAGIDCLVIVIKGMKPAGALYIVHPKDSQLERDIKARIG